MTESPAVCRCEHHDPLTYGQRRTIDRADTVTRGGVGVTGDILGVRVNGVQTRVKKETYIGRDARHRRVRKRKTDAGAACSAKRMSAEGRTGQILMLALVNTIDPQILERSMRRNGCDEG